MPTQQEAKHEVEIVIPLYKEQLTDWEAMSLANTMKVFTTREVVLLKPEGLDIGHVTAMYPRAKIISVSNDWLGTKRGIVGYNEMMMSEAFYDLFPDTDYILVCHTDAWVFNDDLSAWCDGTYDIVAAPWPTKPRHKYFPLKQLLRVKKRFLPLYRLLTPPKCHIPRFLLSGKIGNGGLSLRKVSSLKAACHDYASDIDYFISHQDMKHNEDVFWALVPQKFTYPDEMTALRFSFDTKPRLCFKLNNGHLPMGCHGFMHKRRVKFWAQFIPV